MGSSNSRSNGWEKANFVLTATNAIQLLQLQNQQAAMNRKFDQAQRQQAERSFAHWRQTPDGQLYTEWKAKVSPLVVQIFQADDYWKNSSEAYMKASVSDLERSKAKSDMWAEAPAKHRYTMLVLISGLVALLGFFISSLAGLSYLAPLFVWLSLLALLALIILIGFGTYLPFWKEENDLARARASEERITRLGFDPLTVSEWPINIWANESFNQAHRIADIVANEVTRHPSPEELIHLTHPVIVPYSRVPAEQLHPVLKKIKDSF